MKTDSELLREYVEEKSNTAFAALVERHLNLVYSAALRQVGGDAHLAQDAVQIVFGDLARKAAALTGRANLVGWLYTGACYAAAKLVRSEQRRNARERAALLMQESTADDAAGADWERLRPLLDRAMLELNETEREAVLQRFFNGWSFAEIGKAQALSEDTARKRVERALGKLQRRLARNGVTSTGLALGLVLSREAVRAAPAGLATSVSEIALASTAGAVGSGLGAGFFPLMTATKISGTLAAAIVLCLSLCLNLFLALGVARETPPGSSRARPAVASQKTGMASAPASMAAVSRAVVADADLGLLRDQLRAAGASEMRAREIVYGVLRWRYREAQTKKRVERIERGWWKDEQRTLGITNATSWLVDDPGLLKKLIDDQIEALFGLDPTQVEVVNARYAYLPEEKRMKLARLERELQIPWVPTGDPVVDAKAEADQARATQENRTEREKLLASLTPEQRREHEMRYGPLGKNLANEFLSVPGGTEEEFRKLYRIAEEYAGTRSAPPSSAIGTNPAVRAAADVNQRIVERIVGELGYDRALDYLWSGNSEYRAMAALAALPATTPGRFAQLVAETGAKAAAIHQNAALDAEQRSAALVELQQGARHQLDTLVPAEAQQKLPASALTWLTQMSAGRYKIISPSSLRGGSSSLSLSIGSAASLPPGSWTPPPVRSPAP